MVPLSGWHSSKALVPTAALNVGMNPGSSQIAAGLNFEQGSYPMFLPEKKGFQMHEHEVAAQQVTITEVTTQHTSNGACFGEG